MKIVWLLNHYAAEPAGAGGTRHYALARYAERYGVRIIVIAASVEHLTGRQRLPGAERVAVEELDGVTFVWIKTSGYADNGPARIGNMLQYTLRVLRPAVTAGLERPDLVVGSSVHPLAALAAMLLARRHRVPFVFEIRDLWPETLIAMGRIRRHGIAAWALRLLERTLCRGAARIVVLMPRAHLYLRRLGVPEGKIAWIPNGVDLNGFEYRDPRPVEHPLVMYVGAHGAANGLEIILKAVRMTHDRGTAGQLRYRFVGDGPEKSNLQGLVRSLGLDGVVSFAAPVSKQDVPETLAGGDFFVLNVRDLMIYEFGLSFNKLFDFLAAGRPVVFAGPKEDNVISAAGAGIVVAGDDVAGLAGALEQIAGMSFEERLEIGRRGRHYAQSHCSYETLSKRFCAELSSLIG